MCLNRLLFLIFVLFLSYGLVQAVPPAGKPSWDQDKFWFRDDDGGEIEATGFSSADVNNNKNIVDVARGAGFRLRFSVKVNNADGIISPRLEFKEGTDCETGIWTTVTSASSNMQLRLSSNFDDNDPTSQQLVVGPFFMAGAILESTNPASALSLPKKYSTEYEWSLKIGEDVPLGATYSFRVTNNGAVLDNYKKCPSLTTQSSLGGGRPFAKVVRPKILKFSGQAYPGSKIEVLFKSAVDELYYSVPEAAWSVSQDGKFDASYTGLIGGNYFFVLRFEDKDGRKTGIQSFKVSLGDELFIENILVPPTVGFLRTVVRKGDFLAVLGYAAPESIIEVKVDGWLIKEKGETKADGFYKILIPTSDLSFGVHKIQTQQKDRDGAESDFSLEQTFVISRLFLPKTDLNSDDKIDIGDWSIFLSLWSLEDREKKIRLDFNNDGKVDISDFAVFIRTVKL